MLKITTGSFNKGNIDSNKKSPKKVKVDFEFFADSIARDPDIVQLEREFKAIQDN